MRMRELLYLIRHHKKVHMTVIQCKRHQPVYIPQHIRLHLSALGVTTKCDTSKLLDVGHNLEVEVNCKVEREPNNPYDSCLLQAKQLGKSSVCSERGTSRT